MRETRFKIPARGEMPSKEMVAFMHECQQPWDGDDNGVSILVGRLPNKELDHQVGVPGDWVVRDDETRLYSIRQAEDADETGAAK